MLLSGLSTRFDGRVNTNVNFQLQSSAPTSTTVTGACSQPAPLQPLVKVPELQVPEQDPKAHTCSTTQTPSPTEQVTDIHESDSDEQVDNPDPNDIHETHLVDSESGPAPVGTVQEPDQVVQVDTLKTDQ